MSKLPVDIWWIIMKMVWRGKWDLSKYTNYQNAYESYNTFKYLKDQGIGTTPVMTYDLFQMRMLCKTTKRMVDKYSKRYIGGYTHCGPKFFIFFPYEK